jgi:hypothetical protein
MVMMHHQPCSHAAFQAGHPCAACMQHCSVNIKSRLRHHPTVVDMLRMRCAACYCQHRCSGYNLARGATATCGKVLALRRGMHYRWRVHAIT